MLSCEVNGEIRYIWKFTDFEECMDPSVYKAVAAFFGANDAKHGDYLSQIENLECRVDDLEYENEELDDKNTELEDDVERLEKRVEELEKEIELTDKYHDALKEIFFSAKEALAPNE